MGPRSTPARRQGQDDRPSGPRVLLLTPVFPPAQGGIESLSLQLCDSLGAADVLVLTGEQDGWEDWDAASTLRVRRVANVPRGGRKSQARLTVSSVSTALAFRPDVVVSMHIRLGGAAELVRRITGARWVQYYHAKEVPTWRRQAAWCARRADAHIAVSRYTAGLVVAAGAEEADVHVVPPGVFLPTAPVDVHRENPPRLLTISRLADDYKGHDVVIKALPHILSRVPDVHWDIVGDGHLRPGLEKAVDEAGVGAAVTFHGSVPDARRDELLDRAHLFVMPSRVTSDGRGGEGFGITYVEAAARGVPVVAAREGGALDAVADGRTGLLVDPRNPHAVADAVVRLLCDGTERMRFAAAGLAWAQSFSWENIGRATAAIVHGERAGGLLHAEAVR